MIRDPVTPTLFQRRVYGTVGLAVLVGLYLLVGLTVHDPWRGDDARHFGPVLAMLRGESWLFPLLAGQPLTDYPPLYYWVAAAFARASAAFLPAHAGARLASAFFVALAIYWVARAAQSLHGRPVRTPAALLALGTLGLVLHTHETQPLLALFAALALTLSGLAELPARPLAGGLKAGAGSGLAFLAAGFGGLLVSAPLLPLAMLLSPDCRTPRASGALLLGLCLALALTALWPLALHLQHPDLLTVWLRAEWLRLAGPAIAPAEMPRLLELQRLVPVAAVAAGAVGAVARSPQAARAAAPAATAERGAGVCSGWWRGTTCRRLRLIPLVPAIALLAAGGVPTLRRGAANALDWFSLMSLAVFGMLVWLALERPGGRLAPGTGTPRGTQRAGLRPARRRSSRPCRPRDQRAVDPARRPPAALAVHAPRPTGRSGWLCCGAWRSCC
jgi:4-amino-4-deoxy-L-arabinose transferase-like glycosyltransferase